MINDGRRKTENSNPRTLSQEENLGLQQPHGQADLCTPTQGWHVLAGIGGFS